jgi:hypothetical protein
MRFKKAERKLNLRRRFLAHERLSAEDWRRRVFILLIKSNQQNVTEAISSRCVLLARMCMAKYFGAGRANGAGGFSRSNNVVDRQIMMLLGGGGEQKEQEADDTEAKLLTHLESVGIEGIVAAAKLDESTVQLIEGITLAVVTNVFIGEGAVSATVFKSQLVSYGTAELQAHKLFIYLRSIARHLKEKKQLQEGQSIARQRQEQQQLQEQQQRSRDGIAAASKRAPSPAADGGGGGRGIPRTPITYAESAIETTLRALAGGLNLNFLGSDGLTPLIRACCEGQLLLAMDLVTAGADMDVMTAGDCGYTALMMACVRGHSSIALALIRSGANYNIQREIGGNSAPLIALKLGLTDVVKVLIEVGYPYEVNGLRGSSFRTYNKVDTLVHSNRKFMNEFSFTEGEDISEC